MTSDDWLVNIISPPDKSELGCNSILTKSILITHLIVLQYNCPLDVINNVVTVLFASLFITLFEYGSNFLVEIMHVCPFIESQIEFISIAIAPNTNKE